MPTKRQEQDTTSQVERFRKAAKALETDDREEAFDEKLRKVAKATPPKSAAKD